MGVLFLNLLSDKIAMLYGDLKDPENMKNVNLWTADRYTTINNYSYVDNDSVLHINLKENVLLNYNSIILQDPETGEELEYIPYRDMTEEEFFQLTTIHDFGNCDFDDITFAKRHIDTLTSYGKKFHQEVHAKISEYYKNLHNEMAKEITMEIDRGILDSLTESANIYYKPTMKTVSPIDYKTASPITWAASSILNIHRGEP